MANNDTRSQLVPLMNDAIDSKKGIQIIYSNVDRLGPLFLLPKMLQIFSSYKWPYTGDLISGFTMSFLIPVNGDDWDFFSFNSMMWSRIKSPRFTSAGDVRELTFIENGRVEHIPI